MANQGKTPKLKLRFITSAADLRGCPDDLIPEVALAGRSNAGKSSFLNGLAGGAKIAKISSTPGKTRLLNFFAAGEHYRLVDMPGYGFAARSGDEMRDWHQMVEHYLSSRRNLAGLLIVMDVRRSWSSDEQMLVDWLQPMEIPAAVVLTKIDKVSKNDFINAQRAIRKQTGLEVFTTSALKGLGYAEVEEAVFEKWVKPALARLEALKEQLRDEAPPGPAVPTRENERPAGPRRRPSGGKASGSRSSGPKPSKAGAKPRSERKSRR